MLSRFPPEHSRALACSAASPASARSVVVADHRSPSIRNAPDLRGVFSCALCAFTLAEDFVVRVSLEKGVVDLKKAGLEASRAVAQAADALVPRFDERIALREGARVVDTESYTR